MSSMSAQFPIPGTFDPAQTSPPFNPGFDGQFSSGLTTEPYLNGLFDDVNLTQELILSGALGTSGGVPFANGGTGTNPTTGSGSQIPTPNPFDPAQTSPPFNPSFDGQFSSGLTTEPYLNGLFDNVNGTQYSVTGSLPPPSFDGQFATNLTSDPNLNALFDSVNQMPVMLGTA